MNRQPPEWIFRILRSFCPPALAEEIEGDLLEQYYRHARASGYGRAKRRLFWSTLRFFRPGILLRNKIGTNLNPLYMLLNYLKISARVMQRSKAFTAINVSGLILGITGALLLFLWIRQEADFDTFHEDVDNIHIAWNRAQENGQIHCWSTTPRVLAPTLREEYAAVTHAASFADWDAPHLFTRGDAKMIKTTGAFTDAAFLSILSYPLLHGDRDRALATPEGIVLTRSFARELFGHEDVLAEPVSISQDGYTFNFVVTGVLEDLPPNTHFNFEYLLSFKFLESLGEKDDFWGNHSVTTLVKLAPGTELEVFNQQVKDIEKKHYADGQHIEIFLFPLNRMRLYSRFENGVSVGGRIDVIGMLGILGVCLVAIACVNFINLTTARAQRRAREVAVRKVSGAQRTSLVTQFLMEGIMTAWIAGIVAVALAYVLLPPFNALIHQHIGFDLQEPRLWGTLAAGITAVGILAGSYPALYLSSFAPVQVLKGLRTGASRGVGVRSALVVFQFGFAVTMIISAIVVSRQIRHVQHRETGYNRDQLLYIPLTGDLQKNFQSFRDEVLQQGLATAVTRTSAPLTEQFSGTTGLSWRGKNPEERTNVERIFIDEKISQTAGVRVIQGRDLDLEAFPSDSSGVLINETALALMGFSDPVGERIRDGDREYHVVGVVKDFVFTSPLHPVEPIVLLGSNQRWAFNVVYLKLSPAHAPAESIDRLGKVAARHNPEYPFEYQFADAEYERKFYDLKSTLTLTTIFTSVAIAIACMGLLGLGIFMSETRKKEIGIRKAMGGTVLNIVQLLSFSSLKPVMISTILFTPLAWLAMEWWLNSFAYRIEVTFGVVLLSSASILAISLLTIIGQTIRAAMVSPATTLRND